MTGLAQAATRKSGRDDNELAVRAPARWAGLIESVAGSACAYQGRCARISSVSYAWELRLRRKTMKKVNQMQINSVQLGAGSGQQVSGSNSLAKVKQDFEALGMLSGCR